MSDIAIKVENISKRYRIGLKEELHDTLIGSLTSWVKYPLSNFRRVQKLSKFSGDGESKDIIWALRDVSFEVKQGEVLGIIGKNGAGKSTLLKILCRITEPTSGRAEVHGRVASLLEVGTGFHPELTGRENVFLNGAILGMTKEEIERKFDEIVDFSGVEKFIDTPVKRYSSGMRVRLAFAVAAHLEPEILLIDEVLAVGDAKFQKKCLGKMKDISERKGRTVLFVSHNMGMVNTLCGRSILLDQGRIYIDDASSIVISEYINNIAPSSNGYITDANRDPSKPIQIRKVCVLDDEKEVKTRFDVFEQVTVQVTYEVMRKIVASNIALVIKRNGEPLFASFDTDSNEDLFEGRMPGMYTAEIQLPCPLKAGVYFVYVDAGIPNQSTIHTIGKELRFDIEELSFDPSKRGYSIGRPGVIAAHLEWNTVRDQG